MFAAFRWHPRFRLCASRVAPVRGGTYFSLQRQRKVGKRKPLLNLRCLPGYRFGTGSLSCRAAKSARCRKRAVNRARRENPTHSLEHIPPQLGRRQTDKTKPTECAPSGCHLSRCARLTAGFLRSVGVAARQLNCGMAQREPGRHRRFEAAFFCLLFFAAAKKSRCRPAQGQRVKHGYEFADASAAKQKRPVQKERAFAQRKQKTYLDFELIIASDTLFGVSAYCLNSIV
jgi:hypothetical protein